MKYNLETGMQSLPFSSGILHREFPEVRPLVKTWQVADFAGRKLGRLKIDPN